MIQVIGQGTRKAPTTGQRLSAGLGQAIETGQKLYEKNQRDKAMQQAGFGDLIGLDPDLQKLAVADRLKGQRKQQEFRQQAQMLGLDFPEEGGQSQSFGDQINRKPQQGPQDQQQAQHLWDNLSDEQRTLFAMQNHQAASALERNRAQNLATEKFKYKKETDAEKEKTRKFEALKKETEPARKEIADRAEVARRGIQEKEKLIDLINTGKIDDPTYAAFLEALPGNFGKRFMSPETVEYKAGLVQNYGDLKTLFTGATRVKEIEILEAKIPDIYLTDQQKKQILLSSIEGHKADLIREEAAQEVEAEGKPLNRIQFQKAVEERARPRINALANRVIDQQKSVIKDAENRKKIRLSMEDPEDVEIIDQILKEAGGDFKKAEALAKKKGYSF